MVLVSRKNRKLILEQLFKEGVLTVQKDGLKPMHDHIPVPNLHVMMVMKSLTSKDLVKCKFNWQWFYYFLTDEGIEKLREELHLPATVFPATLTKQTKGTRPGYAGDVEDRERPGKGKGKGKKGKGKGKGWSSGGGDAEKPAEGAAEE
jgi:small subunit ribosomal protein S10e